MPPSSRMPSDHPDPAIDDLLIHGWTATTVADAATELRRAVAQGAAPLSMPAARLAHQLATLVAQDPQKMARQLNNQPPEAVPPSPWDPILALLDSDLPVATLCRELRRHDADPVALVIRLLEVLDHKEGPESEEICPRQQRATQALLDFEDHAGLIYLLNHLDLLTIEDGYAYHELLVARAAELDRLAAELFEQYRPARRYTLLAIFADHDLPMPLLMDKALASVPVAQTWGSKMWLWDHLCRSRDARLVPALVAALDRTLIELGPSSAPTQSPETDAIADDLWAPLRSTGNAVAQLLLGEVSKRAPMEVTPTRLAQARALGLSVRPVLVQ